MSNLTIKPNEPDMLVLQLTETDTLQLNSAPIVVINEDGSGGDADTLQGEDGAYYLDRDNHTGTQAISTVSGLQTELDSKLPASSYSILFLGLYASILQLETAHPTANAGQYAQVDWGLGTDVIIYVWDVSDEKWIPIGSSSIANTDQLPEGTFNFYFTAQRVRDTTIGALPSVSAVPIVQTDSLPTVAAKLQAQISGLGNGYDLLFTRGRASLNRLLFTNLNPAQIIHNGQLTVPAEYNVIGGACLFEFDLYTSTTAAQSGTYRIFVSEANLINSSSTNIGASSADGVALSCQFTFLRASASFVVLALRVNGSLVAKQRISNPNVPAAGNEANFSIRWLSTANEVSLEYIESMTTIGYGNKP